MNPDADAVVTPSLTLSYAELVRCVRSQADILVDAGITDTSIVGIRCADESQHLLFCLAVACLGGTSCTLPSHEPGPMQEALGKRCGITHVVDERLAFVLANAIAREPDALAQLTRNRNGRVLFATSGTTGDAKLVVHHETDLVAQAHRHVGSSRERFACLASIEHNFAKRHRLYCLAMGASNVFLGGGKHQLVDRCRALGVNVLHVSAFQAQELLSLPDIGKLSDIRLKLGGSHVPHRLRQQLRETVAVKLQAGYGTTETGAIAFTDPDDEGAGESVGRPLPGMEVRAVSPEREPLGTGVAGELAVRCTGMFRGYLGNPVLTAERLDNGWFYTGDLGFLDESQRIHVCGRIDDMFVFNSMNIYPQEIESRIREHPDVEDVAVMPKASTVHGSIPVALLVLRDGAQADLGTLKQFVRERVGVRCPRQFTVVDGIPRNRSGKISRRQASRLSDEMETVRASVFRALQSVAGDSLNARRMSGFVSGDTDIDLRRIEMDSLASMDFLVALETSYDLVIAPQELAELRSLGDIVDRVMRASARTPGEPGERPVAGGSTASALAEQRPPDAVRLLRRLVRYCPTVAHLNKALSTLEHRLTPSEVECLHQWHRTVGLAGADKADKFGAAVTRWLDTVMQMMAGSGKRHPEPFTARRVAPTLTHFAGPGSPGEKCLLVCFSHRGGRQLMMPNSVLLQHTDANRFDILVVAEPLREGYLKGVPQLGTSVTEVVESIGRLDLVKRYRELRTLGCSAGGYAAVIAGFRLGAELAVCVGGRFHSERYPLKILNKIATTWRAVRHGHCPDVIFSFAVDKGRDRRYAKIMARLCGGRLIGVDFTDEKARHAVLQRIVERGELAPFMASTVFAPADGQPIATEGRSTTLSFPLQGEANRSEKLTPFPG